SAKHGHYALGQAGRVWLGPPSERVSANFSVWRPIRTIQFDLLGEAIWVATWNGLTIHRWSNPDYGMDLPMPIEFHDDSLWLPLPDERMIVCQRGGGETKVFRLEGDEISHAFKVAEAIEG